MSLTDESVLGTVDQMLEGLNYSDPGPLEMDELSNALQERLKSFDFGKDNARLKHWIRDAVVCVMCFYPHVSFDNKALLGILLLTHAWVDDSRYADAGALGSFIASFHTPPEEVNPDNPYQRFADEHRKLLDFYDPFITGLMISSVTTAASGRHIENLVQTKKIPLDENADAFPYFLRYASGFPGFYFLAIFPKVTGVQLSDIAQALPYMLLFEVLTNDVISAYKESHDNELNLIAGKAFVSGKSPQAVLEQVAAEVVDANRRTRLILKDHETALKLWDAHVEGMIRYHIHNPIRYRLPAEWVDKHVRAGKAKRAEQSVNGVAA